MNFNVDNPAQYKIWHVIGLSVVMVFPVCLLRDVSNLRYAAILSILSISYTTIVVLIELPMYWLNGKNDDQKVEYFKFNWGFLSAFGITFFAFMSQTGFYAAIERLTKRDTTHLTKVIPKLIYLYRLQCEH